MPISISGSCTNSKGDWSTSKLFDFFAETVQTLQTSDPIDLNASSIRPVILTEVLPSPQGLLILSERQQFQLLTTDAQSMTSGNM